MTDYHDFTNIDTPKDERRKLGVGDIWMNAVECRACGEVIRSKNRHDYQTCKCGGCSVDGGSWYSKQSGNVVSRCESYTDVKTEAK